MFLAGCVATPPLEKVQATQVCENNACKTVSPADAGAIIDKVRMLFADGLSREFKPCEARSGEFTCVDDDIGLFVMGGPIPGRGALKSLSVLSATAGSKPGTVKQIGRAHV